MKKFSFSSQSDYLVTETINVLLGEDNQVGALEGLLRERAALVLQEALNPARHAHDVAVRRDGRLDDLLERDRVNVAWQRVLGGVRLQAHKRARARCRLPRIRLVTRLARRDLLFVLKVDILKVDVVLIVVVVLAAPLALAP